MRPILFIILTLVSFLATSVVIDRIILNSEREEVMRLSSELSQVRTENLELIRENWRLQKECNCLQPTF